MTTPKVIRPDYIKVGSSVLLVKRRLLSDEWGLSSQTITRLLSRLQIPTMRVGTDVYLNAHTLEAVLYFLLRTGGTPYHVQVPSEDHGRAPTVLTLPDSLRDQIRDPYCPIHIERALTALGSQIDDRKALEEKLRALTVVLKGPRKPRTLKYRAKPVKPRK